MEFQYLDHTADVMFEAYGKTIEETFANSARAAFNIITDISKVAAKKSFYIEVKAGTYEKLLFDFLDELLFYLDTEHILFSQFRGMRIVKHGKNLVLSCEAFGDIASGYERHGDIKAPTYNEMSIKKAEAGYVIRAVVDI